MANFRPEMQSSVIEYTVGAQVRIATVIKYTLRAS